MSSCAYVVLLVIAAGVIDCVKAEEPFALPIIGGETSPVSEFPFLVSLSRDGGSRWSSICGGSIINESFILTAAHCKRDIQVAQIRVVAGLYDLTKKDTGQSRSISDFIIHPRYSDSVFANYDIAVIRLSNPLTLKAGEVEKATLNTDSSCPKGGAPCINTGWGRTSPEEGTGSNVRKKCVLSAYSLEECRKVKGVARAVGSVCAVNPTGAEGSCYGDSGGPLISQCGGRQTVVGVASCVTGECITSKPAYYTRVSFFQKWIATGDTSEVIPSEPGGGGLSGETYSASSNGLNCGFYPLLILALLVPNIF